MVISKGDQTMTPNPSNPFGIFWQALNAHMLSLGRPEITFFDAREAWDAALLNIGEKRMRGELKMPRAAEDDTAA